MKKVIKEIPELKGREANRFAKKMLNVEVKMTYPKTPNNRREKALKMLRKLSYKCDKAFIELHKEIMKI